MSRRKNPTPSIQLNVALPKPIWLKLTFHLYSDLEGRVPFGAYQRFITELLQERFDQKGLDLGEFVPGVEPGTLKVYGIPDALEVLRIHLEEKA